MQIDGKQIGPGHAPWVCAEISGEHKGDFGRLLDLLIAAKDAGADSVKLQCFDPERLAEARGGRDKVLTEGLWAGRSLIDLYRETHTPRAFISEAMEWGKRWDITVFSSVFDEEGVDYLESLGCPAYKVSAYEFRDTELIAKVASTQKPMIMSVPSTATADDIRAAMLAAANLNENIAYLHCVSLYPCPDDKVELERMVQLRGRFEKHGWVVGFSDHTVGIEAAVNAVKAGACIIEKHVTLSRSDGGLDAAFSLEPHELAQMVKEIRSAH